jgi:O-antigen/teichoic acid export membrane protein
MKLGQTSAIHFLANIGTSVLGFLATIYLTHNVPQSALASYFLVVAVLISLNVALGRTIQKAVRKRLSESGDGGFVGAGLLVQAIVVVVLVIALLAFRGRMNEYLRADATLPLVGLVVVTFAFSFVQEILKGQHDVHVAAVLQPLDRGVRSVLQVGAIGMGYGLSGLLVGYAVGSLLAVIVGVAYVTVRVYRPTREHFISLFRFARYSWLGMLGNRAFASMDTLVLGLLISTSSLITYYEIAWNVASLLGIFGVALSETLFPEISKLNVEGKHDRIRSLMEDAISYAGLFLLPGFVGSLFLGGEILHLYGSAYTQASTVLVVLIFGRIAYAYESQFVNALNGLDRPDLAFRINGAFIGVNIGANFLLIYLYGWIGAAFATTTSSGLALVLAYRYLDDLIGITIPYGELVRQVLAAVVMGGAVYAGQTVLGSGTISTLVLVAAGAAVYFAALIGVSGHFRRTVARNLPI